MDVSGSYGQLELLRSLGRSELYEVYLAQRTDVEGAEGQVVVKRVLPEAASDEAFVNALLDEAGSAGRLKHPSVVRVLDLGEWEGAPFVASEYVPGGTAAELLDRRRGEPLPIGDALHVMAQVCEGLEHAHSSDRESGAEGGEGERATHGNLKPTNVLLSIDGEVKLTDFGLARARSACSGARPEEGPAPWVAPEQERDAGAGAPADVYACGALLHLLASGRPPRRPGDEEGGASGDEVDLPAEVKAIISKAMSEAAGERFASCSNMLAAIARAAATLGVRGDSKSLTALVRKAFPVFGGTAPVVDAVSSAPPPPGSFEEPSVAADGGATEEPAEEPPAPAEGPPEADATAAPDEAPSREEPKAPAPVEAAPVAEVTRRAAQAPAPTVSATDTTVRVAGRRSPGRASAMVVGLVVAVVFLALIAVGATVVAVLLARRTVEPGPDLAAPPVETPVPLGPTPSGQGGSSAIPAPAAPASPYPTGAAPQPVPLPPAATPPSETPSAPPGLAPGADPAGAPSKVAGDAAAPEAAPEPPRRPGYLTVLTRPYSKVYLDGRLLGTTPILRRQVPSGEHRLHLVAEGHPGKRLTVRVAPGRLTQINQSFAAGTSTP